MKYVISTIVILSQVGSLLGITDKILIMTHAHSRPDMIELHVRTFNAFLEDEYEYVVFNDAPNKQLEREINETCKKLNVKCLRVPEEMHVENTPGGRHMGGLRYSLESMGFEYDGIVLIIDSDMFLIKPLHIKSFVGEEHLVAAKQWRKNSTTQVTYISPAAVFINMATAPNKKSISFYGGRVEGLLCDVGGHFHYYFKNNPDLRYRFVHMGRTTTSDKDDTITILNKDKNFLKSLGYDKQAINFILDLDPVYIFEFYCDGYFLHYFSGGSNWRQYPPSYIAQKNHIMRAFIDNQLTYYDKK
ncbi:hypothetical protein KJZ61_04380 [Candidatus Dependentiae bacterium]|nr:hypothetical protein [Candidatus Dependentiae bacterium]